MTGSGPYSGRSEEHTRSYDYGPPTTQGDDPETAGTPQDNSEAVVVEGESESPLAPPPNTGTVTEPGGSPSDEILELHDPNIVSLTPNTAAIGADASVTVTGTNFRDDSVVEADQVEVSTTYVSETELLAVLSDPGVAGADSLSVRNPTSQMESNSVDFTWTE